MGLKYIYINISSDVSSDVDVSSYVSSDEESQINPFRMCKSNQGHNSLDREYHKDP